MNRLMTFAFVTVALAGCGNNIQKNIDACNAWLDASECGDFDFSTVIDCNVYDNDAYKKCDISGYFDCLATNTTCDEALGIATVDAAACTAEASCE